MKINNYNEFYSAINDAVTKGKKDVIINILNFKKDVYNIEATVKKIYDSIGKSGQYSWTEEVDEIHNSKIITLTFQ